MRVSQTVKNIIAGVSQQPAILRHMEQLEEQVNAFSTTADGLQKRPPTIHIKQIDLPTTIKPKIHTIDRDARERYIVAFTGTGVKVWDVFGNEKVVHADGDTTTYVTCDNPRRDIRAVTVADYTFIVNRNIKAQMSDEVSKTSNSGGIVYVKNGQYGRNYQVLLNNSVVASWQTPDGSQASHSTQIGTDVIMNHLADGVSGKGYSVTRGDNWFMINDLRGQTLKARDGFNNQAISSFTNTVQKFIDLPNTAPNGYTVLIKGESSADDDYYVQYNERENVWEETTGNNLKNRLNASTMPHTLIRGADGSFTLKAVDWANRFAGDDDSNPTPSFIGKFINDVFFFRNRLGFIAGESICLSKSGDFFNFWLDSATSVVETDPIDLNVSHNQVSILHAAIPFNQDLYLFSQQTQFILRADGVLSPKNCQLNQVTEFTSNAQVKPVGVGRNLYFTSERADYTTVREYYAIYDSASAEDSNDITSHVPNYLHNSIYDLLACGNEDLLACLSTSEEDTIYIYKFLFAEDTKVQSSWSKWVFDGTILGAGFINSTLFIVIERSGHVYLERLLINFNTTDFDNEPYRCLMDRKRTVKTTLRELATLNSNMTSVTFDAKAYFNDTDDKSRLYYIVFPDGLLYEGIDKIIINLDDEQMLDEVFTFFLGTAYDMQVTFSTFYIKKSDQTGTTPISNYRLILQNLNVNYTNSGEFMAYVKTVGKPLREYKFTSRILGYDTNRLGYHPLTTGIFKIPVHGTNTETTVYLRNSSPLPSSFVGYTWEGNVTYRYRQM